MYPPDGLLTLGDYRHDVDLDPHIIAPDPFASDNCLNDFPPACLSLLTKTKELNTMNTGDDEPPSGLNGRLRPRKSHAPNSQTLKAPRKPEGKTQQDNPKKAITPSKPSPNKHDDLVTKSDFSPTPQFLCAFCDRKFTSKQTMSKHARRIHLPTSKQDCFIECLFCNHGESSSNNIMRHMVDNHPNQYFACLYCHTRFPSTFELAEHKLGLCEKQKVPYRCKLRQKTPQGSKKNKKSLNIDEKRDFNSDVKDFQDGHDFNGIVISCELKPSQVHNEGDIEENITTNLILPPNKSLGNSAVLDKNAVIVLDDIQWNKRIPSNFSFHNTDADQILSRLGVVHRSPRTAESSKRDWLRTIDDSMQKFERCFDTSFYSKVASNVQENLTKFLDGSFNFNPDPDSIIKTRKSKNNVVINTAEGFPILLAFNQVSRNILEGYMPRATAPKHKWKWDNLESDKNPINADQIRRDSHANNCIITLVSSLDIWTQLCMRRKFEDKFSSSPLEKKTEKQNVLGKELKEILESREIPTSSSQVVKYKSRPIPSGDMLDFPAALGLTPSAPSYDLKPAVLSGEWVRPRCYVCCACGAQTRDSRTLTSHISSEHQNAQVQHYEIAGELLLNSDILKHLYVPPSQMHNRTRPLRGYRECTKCRKSISLEDFHQHMLDCAGDTPTVRRRQCRYRPFGVRKRRPRLPDNTVRKKMRKDIRTRQRRQKNLMRPRQRIRTEVGDAETIRKMLADLPAKRHRVVVNPMNQMSRPRRKLDKQRSTLILRKRPSQDTKNRELSTNKDLDSQQTSTSNNNPMKYFSGKEDDDDNKPLITKVSRMQNKTTRRNQPVKPVVTRKAALNRAKRKYVKVKEQKRGPGNINVSNDAVIQELPFGDFPQKIDINTGAYNTRDHANHSGSNNREDRPGSSRSNTNSNNSHAPVQNVPLKHSIARLTADSERHDKSVQFHHLFLVQQECNNTNQHMTSGQPMLFENEAVVTRLDKPPLNFIQRGPLDLQKIKQNKPRKGLNDCIAMLKNKLVDPSPCAPIGHISVQCGTDEPLDIDVPMINHNTFVVDSNINLNKHSEMFNNKLMEHLEPNESNVSLQYTDFRVRSNSIQEGSIDPRPNNKAEQQENLPENKQAAVSVKQKSYESKQFTDGKPEHTPQIKTIETDVEVLRKSSEDISVTPAIVQKPENDGQLVESYRQQQFSTETQNEKADRHSINESGHSKSTDLYPILDPEEVDSEWQNRMEVSTTKSNATGCNPSEVNNQPLKNQGQVAEAHSSPQKQFDIVRENDSFRIEDYGENNLDDVSADIPPAHASTNVALSGPLDLSSKIFCAPEDLSEERNLYISNYDNYGTLDLSNKCSEKASKEYNEISNVVVDLSVKPSLIPCQSSTMDLCLKSTTNEGTEFSILTPASDNVPTDLSMKVKDRNMSIGMSDRNTVNVDYIQDLSNNRSQYPESKFDNFPGSEDSGADFPTDLSSKEVENKNVQSMPRAEVVDFNLSRHRGDSVFRTDSSVGELQNSGVPKHTPTPTNQVTPISESTSKITNLTEYNKQNPEDYTKPVQYCVTDRYLQKPIYDPTLKIPQYKIRTTLKTATTTGLEASNIAPPVSKVVTNLVTTTASSECIYSKTSVECEQIPYGFGKVQLNASICSGVEPIPAYSLPSLITTSIGNKFESTTSVYTLANPYKSTAKIESSCSPVFTNTLVCKPETTMINSTTVYTLTRTTAVAATNYESNSFFGSPLAPATVHKVIPASFLDAGDTLTSDETQTTTNPVIVGDNNTESRTKNNSSGYSEQDPETAKKFAMLPKELVDILGNMPADHRNQLLNVLPQYVSTATATTSPQSKDTDTIKNSSMLNPKTTNTLANVYDQMTTNNIVTTSEPQFIMTASRLIPTSSNSNICIPTQLAGQLDIDQKLSIQFGLHPPPKPVKPQNNIEDTKSSVVIPLQSLTQDSTIDTDKFLIDPFTGAITNRPPKINEYDDSRNRIIDLTDEENLPLSADLVKVAEDLSQAIKLPSQEMPCLIAAGKRQKGNNEKTASLRAVRIKTPSERNKDTQLLKRTSTEQISKLNDPDDNEVNKSAESNKSLAIQQAEISSTQHTNKNIVNSKKANVISPNDLEVNIENTNPKSRRVSTPDEIVVEKDRNLKENVVNPILKSGLVTSSISTNETKRNELNDENVNEASFSSDLKSTPNSITALTQSADKSDEMLETRIHSDQNTSSGSELNISDIPIECSTPKDRPEIEKYPRGPPTSKKNVDGIVLNDEDSEDDVSLAIIVKQKQRLLEYDENVSENVLIAKENTPKNKKRKKEKKQMKVVTKDLSSEHVNTTENTIDLVAGSSSLVELNDPVIINKKESKGNDENSQDDVMCTANITNKHSKKKTKRVKTSAINLQISHMNEASEKNTKTEKIAVSDVKKENIINMSDLKTTIKLNQPQHKNDPAKMKEVVISNLTTQKETQLNADNLNLGDEPQSTLQLTTQEEVAINIKRVDDDIVHYTSKKENINKKKSNNKNIVVIDDSDVISVNQITSDENKDIHQQLIPEQDLFANVPECASSDKDTNIHRTLDPVKSSDEGNENIEGNIHFHSERKKNKKSVRTKKSKDIDISPGAEIDSNNVDENITPLRRSRRGKSLFVDSDLSEHENPINNARIDQKTPLTKKQLIFSKLLLDEETLAKGLDFSHKKDFLKVEDEVREDPSKEDTFNSLTAQNSDNDSNGFSVNKCNKRKKSPHAKRKCKKQKSSDNSFNAQDHSVISNLGKNSSNLVNLLGTQSSMLTDCEVSLVDHIVEKRNPCLSQDRSHKVQPNQKLVQNDNLTRDGKSCSIIDNDELKNITPESNNIHSDHNKLPTSIEKRKISPVITNADCSHSSKPKKTRLSKEIDMIEIKEDDEINIEDKSLIENKNQKSAVSEIRQPTCYNKPIAARRTRSKSVVVKSSSNDLYDPYDIDLDDMNEKTEPFRKKNPQRSIFKECKSYKESREDSLKNDEIDAFTEIVSTKSIDAGEFESINTEIRKNNSGKAKSESCTDTVDIATDNSVKTAHNTISKKLCKGNPALDVEFSSKTKSVLTSNSVLSEVKGNLSDSDESSKSDVPLKKYVEEKEKKMAELDRNFHKETDVMDVDESETANEKETDKFKKSKRSVGISNAGGNSVPNETEEQLRSEQFMESFGFFSERKPRKSNLLATKKISETFHIIANESEDMYYGFKDRTTKKAILNENRKSGEAEAPSKKTKRGRKKGSSAKTTPCYCSICKREFRRPDNYLRHQMTLQHISKLSEIEMKVKTTPVPEEPNYLIAFKQQLDKLKILTNKLAKQKKNSKSKITLPTMEEIIAEVNRTVREQQVSRRGLSRDEALFLDCCELLKESHKSDVLKPDSAIILNDVRHIVCPAEPSVSGINLIEKSSTDEKIDTKSDGDVDSITAKNILESEEVRNLENDLISGLKEAANVGKNFDYHRTGNLPIESPDECAVTYSSPIPTESQYDQIEDIHAVEELDVSKSKKNQVESKDKMYPDLENIDIFEDKFDKIKRKCRSQAAAAKQSQTIVEPSTSHKGRKKSEKKKGKKNLKKNSQNTVLTKGALKGFDGIKVSIPTSDINMSAIVPSLDNSHKKKKKNSSKRKREKKDSESSSKNDSDNRTKDNSSAQKKLDVYEFMDNEDAELFEFRPSTLMERFKSINSKETHSKDASKFDSLAEEAENSSETASDGDDFVYMSDDYVCSDDETENSILSCEMGNVKADTKKSSSPLKRKDVVEKNAMMGKIFKHNLVRSEKKSTKSKEPAKPKANLDQLFDSLLEDEPKPSVVNNDNDAGTPDKDIFESHTKESDFSSKYKQLTTKVHDNSSPKQETFVSPKKVTGQSPERFESTASSKFKSTSTKDCVISSPNKYDDACSSKGYDNAYYMNYGPSTSKMPDVSLVPDINVSKKYDKTLSKKHDSNSSKKYDASPTYGDSLTSKNNSALLESKEKSPVDEQEKSGDYSAEIDQEFDDTGVARQRARRKCTVGKQNVLAETWSSESEPDGVPPRPNSAESVVAGAGRKKKGKKKDAQQSGGGRRGTKNVSIKKQEVESRVNSSNGNTLTSSNVAGGSRVSSGADGAKVEGKGVDNPGPSVMCPPPAVAMPCPSGPPGPSGVKGRPRSVLYYWSSEGDEEQEHLQQHGWIVGDSHKKLVTMLAHAKGRKRNNDDKRHLIE